MAPIVPPKSPEKPWIIRPMALVPESLIVQCASLMELPVSGICRYKEQLDDGDRKYFQNSLQMWEKRIPDLRSNIARSLANPQVEHLLCLPTEK